MNNLILSHHLARQKAFSEEAFGPYSRPRRQEGILDHLEMELIEVHDAPMDLKEILDVVILAFEYALSSGHTPPEIAAGLEALQTRNEGRTYPDWRESHGTAIEHKRTPEAQEKKDRELERSMLGYYYRATVRFNAWAEKVSTSRLNELLDYANAYGEFDVTTPNGGSDDGFTGAMTDQRRFAIALYSQAINMRGHTRPTVTDGAAEEWKDTEAGC